ncbi:hypothetical protein BDY19DRAFT_994093 [Irpex rosettiformis]|uniref:Uncharacterized protein n=1 Tax=Irpex rosettiformis TaxID=378272 RepID=A0ACB8U2Z3_9APHY|nr:hypothetical protein BDY19DRAFT_994093 [Irpex rosettiformis]
MDNSQEVMQVFENPVGVGRSRWRAPTTAEEVRMLRDIAAKPANTLTLAHYGKLVDETGQVGAANRIIGEDGVKEPMAEVPPAMELCHSPFTDWVFENLDQNLVFHSLAYKWGQRRKKRQYLNNKSGKRMYADALDFDLDSEDEEEAQYVSLIPHVTQSLEPVA